MANKRTFEYKLSVLFGWQHIGPTRDATYSYVDDPHAHVHIHFMLRYAMFNSFMSVHNFVVLFIFFFFFFITLS